MLRKSTQDQHNKKEHVDLYKISKFDGNRVNIDQDLAIQKLLNLLGNVWFSRHSARKKDSG
jgi:hypothetical protein